MEEAAGHREGKKRRSNECVVMDRARGRLGSRRDLPWAANGPPCRTKENPIVNANDKGKGQRHRDMEARAREIRGQGRQVVNQITQACIQAEVTPTGGERARSCRQELPRWRPVGLTPPRTKQPGRQSGTTDPCRQERPPPLEAGGLTPPGKRNQGANL